MLKFISNSFVGTCTLKGKFAGFLNHDPIGTSPVLLVNTFRVYNIMNTKDLDVDLVRQFPTSEMKADKSKYVLVS